MTHNFNGKQVTTNELIGEVICSVVEDLENNFADYAKIYSKDWSELNDEELDAIKKWKPKVFNKVYTRLNKKGLV